MDENAIEIVHDNGGWYLGLTCGDAAFQRIVDKIFAEARIEDIPRDKVQRVEVFVHPGLVGRPKWQDRVALYGCAVIVLAFVFPFAVGLQTIWGWLFGR